MIEDRFNFRIWDAEYKQMRYFNLYDLVFCIDAEQPTLYHHELSRSIEREDKIMQCTGLTDTNGDLIYEGDILKINLDSNPEDEFTFHVVEWKNEFPLFGISPPIEDEHNSLYYATTYVTNYVCGNIYENPELLGSKELTTKQHN